MKIRPVLIAITALFASAIAQGQVTITPQNYSLTISAPTIEPKMVEVIDGVSVARYSLSGSKLNGSPYMNDEFVPGTMTTLDGTVIEGLNYRYDIYNDEMQFIIREDTASINKPLALRSIEMNSKTFVYEVYRVSEQMVAAGYFEQVIHGKLSLLFRRQLELEYDNYVPNYGGGGGSKEFMLKKDDSFYVKLEGAAARKVYNKRDLLNALPEGARDLIKQYMKEHRISVKKKEELEEIVGYYNNAFI
jgi:hypothetical protein